MLQRIQKILAQSGITSRRKAEELIAEGRVTVNGKIATLGTKADIEKDHIKVDGKLICRPEKKVYLIFNKPRGVVTSLYDPEGRPTIKNFIKDVRLRVFPVGRLDYDSEGLLLITNDGDFAYSILHPSKKISKTYLVKIKGIPKEEKLQKLRQGVCLEEGLTAPAKVVKIRESDKNCWLQITIHEGKKRQVRRMLEKIGHPVLRLKRIAIGNLKLGSLKPGQFRYLTSDDFKKLGVNIC
jgi:23S rRNA pseudouridine2605 synthase